MKRIVVAPRQREIITPLGATNDRVVRCPFHALDDWAERRGRPGEESGDERPSEVQYGVSFKRRPERTGTQPARTAPDRSAAIPNSKFIVDGGLHFNDIIKEMYDDINTRYGTRAEPAY